MTEGPPKVETSLQVILLIPRIDVDIKRNKILDYQILLGNYLKARGSDEGVLHDAMVNNFVETFDRGYIHVSLLLYTPFF